MGPHATDGVGERSFSDRFDPCCTLGGTVSGLAGSGLVVRLQAGISEDKPITPGPSPLFYRFNHTIPPGSTYTVSIIAHPNGQSCTLLNTSGTAGSTPTDNIDVLCESSLRWDDGKWDERVWN